jgi:2-desacetyl-2-hydroxyethyl bacteriochlorophyllide A dehydrogenase
MEDTPKPRTMRAAVVRPPQGWALERLPVPKPLPGQVRIRVAYCGVNHLDRMIAEGTLPSGAPTPAIPGSEVSGVVDEVGEAVADLDPGTPVVVAPYLFCGSCAVCRQGRETVCPQGTIVGLGTPGGYAEYVVVPRANVIPVPQGMSLRTAAALPLAAATAYRMLFTQAQLKPGEWVLVVGAGGGVASAALRLARLAGARVLAVTHSPGKVERARADGALKVFLADPPAPELATLVRQATGGHGADVVVDPLGSGYLDAGLRSLARGGRWVTCGTYTGMQASVNLWHLFAKELRLLGSYGADRGEVERVLELAASGGYVPPVDRVLTLEEVEEAHQALRASQVYGKILLDLGAPRQEDV